MTWSELLAEAREIHQSEFGDDELQYRDKPDGTFVSVAGIQYPEKVQHRRDATGWKRITTRDFVFSVDDIEKPLIHSQISYEGQIYSVIDIIKSRTSRWVLTATRETSGEISRPQYRRRS